MRGRARGHNLLEMIIACFIFSTVAIGLTTVWIQHSRTMERAGGRMVGQFLANQIMEECIAAGYDKVQLLDSVTPPNSPRAPMDMKETVRDVAKVTKYYPSVKVEHRILPDSREVNLVIVRVEWEEQQSHNATAGAGSTTIQANQRAYVEYQSQLADSGT